VTVGDGWSGGRSPRVFANTIGGDDRTVVTRLSRQPTAGRGAAGDISAGLRLFRLRRKGPVGTGLCIIHPASPMLIASLVFDVLPDKRAEFISAVGQIVESLRSSQGCLACRLVTDCENDNLFVMTSEWDGRTFLDRYLASAEFSILEGTRILLSDGPELSIDELLSRRRSPRPRRRRA
jgi:quinol monooxygenase YgiN